MYDTFFEFRRTPFAATPDPELCAGVQTMQGAFDRVLHCLLAGQGVCVVSAPPGMGKTLLCRRVMMELGSTFTTIFLPNSNFTTRRSFLQALLYELGQPYLNRDEQELRLELSSALRSIRATREAMLLIADDAHLLEESILDEIRALANLADGGKPLTRVLLSGQLELDERLAEPAMEGLNQRIRCHAVLESLSTVESAEYIEFRLRAAGSTVSRIFSDEALELICRAADGLPRALNQLCDHALLLAYVVEQKPVTRAIVEDALRDLRQLPIHWNVPTVSGESTLGEMQDDEMIDSVDDAAEESPADRLGDHPVSPRYGEGASFEYGEVSPHRSEQAPRTASSLTQSLEFGSAAPDAILSNSPAIYECGAVASDSSQLEQRASLASNLSSAATGPTESESREDLNQDIVTDTVSIDELEQTLNQDALKPRKVPARLSPIEIPEPTAPQAKAEPGDVTTTSPELPWVKIELRDQPRSIDLEDAPEVDLETAVADRLRELRWSNRGVIRHFPAVPEFVEEERVEDRYSRLDARRMRDLPQRRKHARAAARLLGEQQLAAQSTAEQTLAEQHPTSVAAAPARSDHAVAPAVVEPASTSLAAGSSLTAAVSPETSNLEQQQRDVARTAARRFDGLTPDQIIEAVMPLLDQVLHNADEESATPTNAPQAGTESSIPNASSATSNSSPTLERRADESPCEAGDHSASSTAATTGDKLPAIPPQKSRRQGESSSEVREAARRTGRSQESVASGPVVLSPNFARKWLPADVTEEQFGEAVLETCLEMQSAIPGRRTPGVAEIPGSSGGMRPGSQSSVPQLAFDVVLPPMESETSESLASSTGRAPASGPSASVTPGIGEPTLRGATSTEAQSAPVSSTAAPAPVSDAGTSEVPQPKGERYAQLFSMLRRRSKTRG